VSGGDVSILIWTLEILQLADAEAVLVVYLILFSGAQQPAYPRLLWISDRYRLSAPIYEVNACLPNTSRGSCVCQTLSWSCDEEPFFTLCYGLVSDPSGVLSCVPHECMFSPSTPGPSSIGFRE